MDDVEKLVKTTLGEIEKVLDSKTVVGEPIGYHAYSLDERWLRFCRRRGLG
jgi:uncharacterized spore protein YtfJ